MMVLSLVVGYFAQNNGYYNVAGKIDEINYDSYHVLYNYVFQSNRYSAKNVAIVSIDSEALDMLKNIPMAFWGPEHADVIKKVLDAGAASVALDVHLLVTPEMLVYERGGQWSAELNQHDRMFDRQLGTGRVALATLLNPGGRDGDVVYPADEYMGALPLVGAGLGFSALFPDADGAVRKYQAAIAVRTGSGGYDGGICPSLALAALDLGGRGVERGRGYPESVFSKSLISYSGPPGAIPRISYSGILRSNALSEDQRRLLAGRIVFVGSDAPILGDTHKSPYPPRIYGYMSGVELHANIAESIVGTRAYRVVSGWFLWVFWVPIAFGVLVVHNYQPIYKKIGMIDAPVVAITWATGFVAFCFDYVLRLGGMIFGITFFFVSTSLMESALIGHIRSSAVARWLACFLILSLAIFIARCAVMH